MRPKRLKTTRRDRLVKAKRDSEKPAIDPSPKAVLMGNRRLKSGNPPPEPEPPPPKLILLAKDKPQIGSGGHPLLGHPEKLPQIRAEFLDLGDLIYRLDPPSEVALVVDRKNTATVIALDRRTGLESEIPNAEVVAFIS